MTGINDISVNVNNTLGLTQNGVSDAANRVSSAKDKKIRRYY